MSAGAFARVDDQPLKILQGLVLRGILVKLGY